jgi:hypothetical protein
LHELKAYIHLQEELLQNNYAPGQIWTEHLTDFSQVTIYAFSMFAFGNDS